MRGNRSVAAWFAVVAVAFAPAASRAELVPNKQGVWNVGVDKSGLCLASAPIKSGGYFGLMAANGGVSFGAGNDRRLREGSQGIFETEAYSFNFKPTYDEGGASLYFDDFFNKTAMAALRLAKRIHISVDRRTVIDIDVQNTGLDEVLDAVIDCSNGKRGWWGRGADLTQASNDEKHDSAPTAGGSGSAFFISADGVAVTAAHVVKGCGRLESPRWGVVKVLAADPRADLAILKAPGASGQYVPLRARGPRLGETMSAAGYPLGQLLGPGLKITTGVVSGLSGPQGDRGLFQLSAPIQPGNSGGPVIDADGALIGVVAAKLDELKLADATGVFPQNINFAVPVTILESFLDENGVAYKTAASAGAVGATATAAMPGYTFAVVCTP
jgi:S1-C subfamily serine protease